MEGGGGRGGEEEDILGGGGGHTGRYSCGHVESWVFGYTWRNHMMASSLWLAPMLGGTLRRSLGVLGGNSTHLGGGGHDSEMIR